MANYALDSENYKVPFKIMENRPMRIVENNGSDNKTRKQLAAVALKFEEQVNARLLQDGSTRFYQSICRAFSDRVRGEEFEVENVCRIQKPPGENQPGDRQYPLV